MKDFEIHEDASGRFATIKARTAVAALREACRRFPRKANDYNMKPGETPFHVTWRAECADSDGWAAQAQVKVPGRGTYGCTFEATS